MELIFFYIFGSLAAISALAVISLRNVLSCALSLVVCLFAVACLFALLGAHFLAAMQVLVYAGAIMVLFVFVVMMMNLGREELKRAKTSFASMIGVLLGGYLGILLLLKLRGIEGSTQELPEDFGTVREVGRLLFTDYMIPFEVVSILILVAIIGAVVLGKKERTAS